MKLAVLGVLNSTRLAPCCIPTIGFGVCKTSSCKRKHTHMQTAGQRSNSKYPVEALQQRGIHLLGGFVKDEANASLGLHLAMNLCGPGLSTLNPLLGCMTNMNRSKSSIMARCLIKELQTSGKSHGVQVLAWNVHTRKGQVYLWRLNRARE